MESKEREIHGAWYTEERMKKSAEFSEPLDYICMAGQHVYRYIYIYISIPIYMYIGPEDFDQINCELLQEIPSDTVLARWFLESVPETVTSHPCTLFPCKGSGSMIPRSRSTLWKPRPKP